jgi:hypothetical protein
MKVIAGAFKDNAELKKYAKKLMPFVQVAKVSENEFQFYCNEESEIKKFMFSEIYYNTGRKFYIFVRAGMIQPLADPIHIAIL